MKVFCEYNQEYDAFLKEAVQYTLDRYESQLELLNLEEIELVDKSKYEIETDGRADCDGKKIFVTSRLYELLPSYNISDLEEDGNFKLIINTLYHEMGHITDWLHMPVLYDVASRHGNTKEGIAALLWLEYLAEKRSESERPEGQNEFCDVFAKNKWRAYKNNQSARDDNFLYLVKATPYFIARIQKPETRDYYFSIMTNELVGEFVTDIEEELAKLEAEMPFDDIQHLKGMVETINLYYREFKNKYEPQKNVPWFFRKR